MDLSSVQSAVAAMGRRGLLPEAEAADIVALDPADAESLSRGAELCTKDRWELVACGLLVLQGAVAHHPDGVASHPSVDLRALLQHDEPRIRNLTAELLGLLAAQRPSQVLDTYCPFLLDNVRATFQREADTTQASLGGDTVAKDDTTGWRSLETSVVALTHVLRRVGKQALTSGAMDDAALSLVMDEAGVHVNRHVRQASLAFTLALIEAHDELRPGALLDRCMDALVLGLQDNWSQVRYAASLPTRALLQRLQEEDREPLWPRLLPRMCLNRHYIADGVKIYSQETWRLIMGTRGLALISEHASFIAEYYTDRANADNHIVREAACHAIAELGERAERESLAPHVPKLLQGLMVCFADDSWPVRDSACVSTGRFVRYHPRQAAPLLPELFHKWFGQVGDPIWSVREGAALALADVMRCEDANTASDAQQRVLHYLSHHFQDASSQPAVEPGARKNAPEAHVDQQLYSCGSLAPKLRKGGCSDCHVSRAGEPWERSDGCVYLLREVSRLQPEEGARLIPGLADLLALSHFPSAAYLHTTVWKQLPAVARAVGKRAFKPHLEPLLSAMYLHLRSGGGGSGGDLRCAAAGDCAAALSDFVGPRVFEGRVPEEFRAEVLQAAAAAAAAQASGRAAGPRGAIADEAAPWVRA